MMAKMLELDLANIDRGRFLPQVEADLRRVQESLVAYAQEHGDAAKGAKATLSVSVALKIEDPKDLTFQITAQSKVVPLAPPASVSYGMAAESQTGGDVIYVREGGSDSADPRQGRLCDSQGNVTEEAMTE